MLMRRWVGAMLLLGVAVMVCMNACASPDKPVSTHRALQEEPREPYLAAPLVDDFLAVCDLMARDLVLCSAVQSAEEPVVVEIKPMENHTGEPLDLSIYPRTVRGIIQRMGEAPILFRDETARAQVIDERIEQTDEPIIVGDHAEETRRRTSVDLGSSLEVGTLLPSTDEERHRTSHRVTEVSGKLRDVDYFLNGFVYGMNEMNVGQETQGFRYLQFQFRLTDSKTGIIVWEQMYQVKRKGDLRKAPL